MSCLQWRDVPCTYSKSLVEGHRCFQANKETTFSSLGLLLKEIKCQFVVLVNQIELIPIETFSALVFGPDSNGTPNFCAKVGR